MHLRSAGFAAEDNYESPGYTLSKSIYRQDVQNIQSLHLEVVGSGVVVCCVVVCSVMVRVVVVRCLVVLRVVCSRVVWFGRGRLATISSTVPCAASSSRAANL